MTVTSRKMSVKKEQSSENKGSNGKSFEEAIEATGFGKFNILLIFLIGLSAWSILFDTSNMSYVFPVAQCDLNLTMNHKGLLNAASFTGMLAGCFVWGILTDKFGRKRVLIFGFSLNFIVALICVLTQSFIVLLTLKIISGFLINGPSNALAAYISEVHSTKYRSRMQMFLGFTYGTGSLSLPAIASIILPEDIHITFFNGYFDLHSWNIFILATSMTSLFAAIGFLFMPESPKFYMSKGDNESALKVFQYMYSLNTGNRKDSFPIVKLTEEKQSEKEEQSSTFSIFKPTYLKNLLILCAMTFCLVTTTNTLRLWMPQILQGIHEYQVAHNGSSASFCEVMKDMNSVEQQDLINCSVNSNNNQDVYFKSMVMGAVAMVTYSVAIATVNYFEKRRLIAILGAISGTIIICVFLSQDTPTILGLTSTGLALIGVSIDVMITILVVIFPTSMRGTALSLSGMFGRLGSIVGNIMFPVLLKTGCKPPFFLLGSIIIGSTLMGLLLPKTNSKSIA